MSNIGDGSIDGKFRIKNGQGLSQAIGEELGLSKTQQKQLGSVWLKIIDIAKEEQNGGTKIYNGGDNVNGKTRQNFVMAKDAVVEFSVSGWNKIVKLVNDKLNLAIQGVQETSQEETKPPSQQLKSIPEIIDILTEHVKEHYLSINGELMELTETESYYAKKGRTNEPKQSNKPNQPKQSQIESNSAEYVVASEKTGSGVQEPDAIKSRVAEKLKEPKYKRVFDIAMNQAVRRIRKNSKERAKTINDVPSQLRNAIWERVEYVSDIVVKMCKKYEIEDLAGVIADMMGNETGGYVFSEENLKNPGKKYKGVLQVDLLSICYMYNSLPSNSASIDNIKKYYQRDKRTISTMRGDIQYNYRHYSRDEARINELKQKYPTPESLYKAIQSDVELGLEVGILAFKGKLSVAKGDVRLAISKFCGNQYQCNLSGTYPHYPRVAGENPIA